MNNFLIIVIDGVGIGEMPDAHLYGDEGSHTLANMAEFVGGLNLPNLQKLGLGNISPIKGIIPEQNPIASYGKLTEVSKGKDSTTGHWELGGIRVDVDFNYYPNGFPKEMIELFLEKTGCKGVLGNKAASGTEIIKELGDEHLKTGYPIIYTSADSVFQIAAHEEVIPLEELYRICKITRHEVLAPPLNVGRVIARPFLGAPGNYSRTRNRKDYSLNPTGDTVLDYVAKSGRETIAIGKINDLFNYQGITKNVITKSNEEGIEKIKEILPAVSNSLIFINLVDFDVYFGHRNDPIGFAAKLKEFDEFIPELLSILHETDSFIITADHGNDPVTPSTDHSREYVPLLYYNKNRVPENLGTRKTFSDVGKTVCDYFNIENSLQGESFL